MAPLTAPGPFNLVTAQTANECFTSVFMKGVVVVGVLVKINDISHNVAVSTSVSKHFTVLQQFFFQGHVLVE